MSILHYRYYTADLDSDADPTPAWVDEYERRLLAALRAAYPDADVTVTGIDGVQGVSPRWPYSDDIDPDDVEQIAEDVFDELCSS